MLYVMLVGSYPFERPEDKGDPKKLQNMIQVCECVYICGHFIFILLNMIIVQNNNNARFAHGHHPYLSLKRILNIEYTISSSLKLSDDCKDIISKILVTDPTKRLTIQEIFTHPW